MEDKLKSAAGILNLKRKERMCVGAYMCFGIEVIVTSNSYTD